MSKFKKSHKTQNNSKANSSSIATASLKKTQKEVILNDEYPNGSSCSFKYSWEKP